MPPTMQISTTVSLTLILIFNLIPNIRAAPGVLDTNDRIFQGTSRPRKRSLNTTPARTFLIAFCKYPFPTFIGKAF
ncbi:hypothetical protein C8R46DRAFT_1226915 [Mycena filopes]|nr:hypothetical protein C8R46DRAFT_1226915 [Mycena filopes]